MQFINITNYRVTTQRAPSLYYNELIKYDWKQSMYLLDPNHGMFTFTGKESLSKHPEIDTDCK